jgi:hypothetical protein
MELSDGTYIYRADTVTCAHCQKICERKQMPFIKGVQRDDPDDVGGVCGGCGRIICWLCAGKRECVPIERKLDEYEARMNRYNCTEV